MESEFVPAVEPPASATGPARWFAFRGGDLLVVVDEPVTVPLVPDLDDLGLAVVRRQYLGALGGVGCWSAELEEGAEPPPGMVFEGLRALFGRMPEAMFGVAGLAAQTVAWDRDHQFCGRCGAPMERAPGERARRCPVCGLTSFPRLSPAVIVLIEREDTGQILMARGKHFPAGFFGIIAGFVEPGESLEEAVRREVREEVGLELDEPVYFGSQPWPFPHALMVGFTARYAAGELRVDDRELAEAGWFGIDEMPRIPPRLSIARRLLDAWAERQGRMLDG